MVRTLVKMEELVTEMAKEVAVTHVNVTEASLAETVKMVFMIFMDKKIVLSNNF